MTLEIKDEQGLTVTERIEMQTKLKLDPRVISQVQALPEKIVNIDELLVLYLAAFRNNRTFSVHLLQEIVVDKMTASEKDKIAFLDAFKDVTGVDHTLKESHMKRL